MFLQVNGFGIESIAKPFKDLNFVQRDALTFPVGVLSPAHSSIDCHMHNA